MVSTKILRFSWSQSVQVSWSHWECVKVFNYHSVWKYSISQCVKVSWHLCENLFSSLSSVAPWYNFLSWHSCLGLHVLWGQEFRIENPRINLFFVPNKSSRRGLKKIVHFAHAAVLISTCSTIWAYGNHHQWPKVANTNTKSNILVSLMTVCPGPQGGFGLNKLKW